MAGEQDQQLLPERVTMGLLPYINAHALDEDYAEAAARRQATEGRERPRMGRMGAAVLAVFAVLAVTAAVQTSQDSVSDEKDRRALIDEVRGRKDALDASRAQEKRLSARNDTLRSNLYRTASLSSGLLEEIQLLNLRSGTVAVTGPGVEVITDDKPDAQSDRDKVLDTDLQKLVNGLWQSGAEAISINGQRLTALSAIRHAGEAITVNYKSLRRPYRVLAVGDPNTLSKQFPQTSSGTTWLDLQEQVGLKFAMYIRTKLRLPAAPVPKLRFANQQPERPVGKEQE